MKKKLASILKIGISAIGVFLVVQLALAVSGVTALMLSLRSCRFEGPLKDEYADWDGNYFYAKNLRSKSTGEDEEQLVKEVAHGDITYRVAGCMDALYEGDDAWLCLSLNHGEDEEEKATALVKYDLKTKLAQTVYLHENEDEQELSAVKIFKKGNDFLIVRGKGNTLFRIDYSGEIIEKDCNRFMSYIYRDKYIFHTIKDERAYVTYMATWEDETFEPIVETPICCDLKHEPRLELIDNKYLMITQDHGEFSETYQKYVFSDYVACYDLESKQLNVLQEHAKRKRAQYRNGYLLTWTMTYLDYQSNLVGNGGHMTLIGDTANNNMLFAIVDGKATFVYDFPNYTNTDFSDFRVLPDGRIYFQAKTLRTDTGYQNAKYILDADGKLTQTKERLYAFFTPTKDEIAYGKYTYWIDRKQLPSLMTSRTVYYLYRTDNESGEVKLMQFIPEEYYRIHNPYEAASEYGGWIRYCLPMWQDTVKLNDYITIKDY